MRRSRGTINPPQKPPSRQTLAQINRHSTKPSHSNDAIPKPSRTMTNPQSEEAACYEYVIVRSPIRRIIGMGRYPDRILPSFIGDPGHAIRTAPLTRRSRGTINPPQKPPSRQTLAQINRHSTKPSHSNDVILKPSRTMTNPQSEEAARYEYVIVRSPIRRITGMGVKWRWISI
ncbi:hypothetical protein TNCV_3174011 [Trichonephila clavipes]|nr:hypothetical protein TNCV_3174011 [Trichonephila clavipes]